MKILYILRNDIDTSGGEFLEEHKKNHEVTIIDIRENKNYEQIVDLIASSDKVISW
ncbi:hypothetical protein BMS3Abin07_00355 [bacterium BMS3Abin07]|nr:hypothetical protein BMS3Abin07_00355 [bacterium BMS3Abin07]GBE32725.1 hypothetical protein BMS3Bbin05_01643 [bacterium BMS3Bbin05]